MPGKHPVSAPDEAPPCFGDRYLADDQVCRACPARAACEPATAESRIHRSLAERVAGFDLDLTAVQEAPAEVYARVYREFFRKSPRSVGSRGAPVLERVAAECQRLGIDLATYIAGNMWAMERWVEANPRIGFQPIHLSGEKAMRRYHAYLGQLSRRFRHAKHTALTGRNAAGKARFALFLGELSVAEEYVSKFMQEGSASWSAAALDARPTQQWRDAQGGNTPGYHRLCTIFGAHRLRRELEYAQLRAAAYLAETYQRGLADRIGFTRFDWESFARLLRRVVRPRMRSSELCLSDVEGVSWP